MSNNNQLTPEEEQYVQPLKKVDLFRELIPSLNLKQRHLIDEEFIEEKDHNAYMTNRVYSFGDETILYANEMNKLHHLDLKLQYDFYFYGLDKRKRYNKWVKAESINNLELVQKYYNCSKSKAKQYLKLHSDDDIKLIAKKMNKGDK